MEQLRFVTHVTAVAVGLGLACGDVPRRGVASPASRPEAQAHSEASIPTEVDALEGIWHGDPEYAPDDVHVVSLVFTRGQVGHFANMEEPWGGTYAVDIDAPRRWRLVERSSHPGGARETTLFIVWESSDAFAIGGARDPRRDGTRFVRSGSAAEAANVPVEIAGRWSAAVGGEVAPRPGPTAGPSVPHLEASAPTQGVPEGPAFEWGAGGASAELVFGEQGYLARWPDREEGGTVEVVNVTDRRISLRLSPGRGTLGALVGRPAAVSSRDLVIERTPDGAVRIADVRYERRR